VSQSRQSDPGERRPAPPPKEADDRGVTAVITLGWVIALAVLLIVRSELPGDARWWIWTCVTGALMGLFGLWYVPFLKGRRARFAAEHAPQTPAPSPAGPPAEGRAGATGEGPQPSSEYVSRDNGSNTVSSTETPGKSTRS
jgi:Protein of unknown function (DUF2530)